MEFCFQPPHSFSIHIHGQPILVHKPEKPLFYVGICQSTYNMRLGHFVINHEIQTKVGLQIQSIKELHRSQVYEIALTDENKLYNLELKFVVNDNKLQIEFPSTAASNYIRSVIEGEEIIKRDENSSDDSDQTHLWFSLQSLPFDEETVRGGGLQFDTGDLRGKVLPIWVSEWYHDQLYSSDNTNPRPSSNTTYHPQPMFSSSRGYTFCAYGSAYAQFDFSKQNFHSFHFAAIPYRLELSLVGPSLGSRLYRSLPEWIHNGIILSVQGGTDVVDEKLRRMHQCGTRIAGIWAQDWCGKRITSFGKRVFWNWKWNESWYPNLKEKVIEWQHDYNDCRFLGYINPYIAVDGSLFEEANEKDFLVKRLDSENIVYQIDFGEFNGAIVDLTNPQAFQWYKKVIETNLIDLGLSGWMADFGEYLPCDVRVHANIPGTLIHNLWPILWARCNHEAIRDAGKLDEIFFFMRSGYLNVQRFCPFFWTGDQSVDFSDHSGLSAGIRSCLSLSLSNVLSVHTDIGGYFGRTIGRTREVLLRWCEMATFNIVMRTHEGNRPASNIQFDSDPICLEFFGRMSRIHAHLKPYCRYVIQKAYEEERSCLIRHTEFEYFFGNDLLIAPVVESEVTKCKVSIPDGEWINIWTNEIFEKNQYEIDAPIGQPAVFYRSTTPWKSLFQELKNV
jgi:alpha-glucosidase